MDGRLRACYTTLWFRLPLGSPHRRVALMLLVEGLAQQGRKAIERAQHIGCEGPVHVYRFTAKETIEAHVDELQEMSGALTPAGPR